MEFLIVGVAILLVLLLAVGLLVQRGRRTTRLDDRDAPSGPRVRDPEPEVLPPAGDLLTPPVPVVVEPDLDVPQPAAGRLIRLRDRLGRSQSSLGRGLLSVLSRDRLDEQAGEDVEDTLLQADVGVAATQELVQRLRTRAMVAASGSPGQLRDLLAAELTAALGPDLDRSLRTLPHEDRPAVVLVVGVNGSGK
ncbi:MAG: signal recognition particle receptor subunit alpha, partial [Geodermatophilaceae bacterium]|nr:signal recognition particle receptor subunit alpha [Geodermatophilaceae bacterium]